MRVRQEWIHCGALLIAGRSDAASGDQSAGGKCRVDYVVGLIPSTSDEPRHILRWASKFTGELVRSSLGGEVYALTGTIDHASPLQEFCELFVDLSPIATGFEYSGNPFNRPPIQKSIAGKYLGRHFLRIPQSEELDDAYWPRGLWNPADGLAAVVSDVVPLLRFLESGTLSSATPRPLRGVFCEEGCGA